MLLLPNAALQHPNYLFYSTSLFVLAQDNFDKCQNKPIFIPDWFQGSRYYLNQDYWFCMAFNVLIFIQGVSIESNLTLVHKISVEYGSHVLLLHPVHENQKNVKRFLLKNWIRFQKKWPLTIKGSILDWYMDIYP